MNADEFEASLDSDTPPVGLSHALQALWYDAKGDWDEAYRHAQAQRDEAGACVHAYLHRAEGDEVNAGYWYRCAGKPHSTVPLDDEWRDLVIALTRRGASQAHFARSNHGRYGVSVWWA